MKSNHNQHISSFQLFFIIIQSQIGIAVISLPYDVFHKAKTDSWLSIILSGIVVQVLIVLIWLMAKKFPNRNLFEVFQLLIGKRIGKLLTAIYTLYFITIASLILSLFGLAIRSWLLPLTPQWIIKLLMICIGVYVVKENLRIISRFYVLSTFVLFIFLLLICYSLTHGTIYYVLPVGKTGIIPMISGIKEAILPFLGFEIFFVIFPMINSTSREKLKIITFANVFTTFFYTLITLACLLFFSSDELKLIPQPVLYLVKSFEFKIIERPDIMFTSLWIVLVATSYMSYLYTLSKGLKTIFVRVERPWFVYLGAVVSLMISLIFNDRDEVEIISKLVSTGALVLIVIVPITMLILSFVLKKKEGAIANV